MLASSHLWQGQGRTDGYGEQTNHEVAQAQNQDYDLICPNILPIYHALEHVKEADTQTQSFRISITYGNNRITKRSSNEGPASIV